MQDPVLVTGAAGFIGFHTAQRLLDRGRTVVGLDSLNAYYDPSLKEARLKELEKSAKFQFVRMDLADRAGVAALFDQHRFPFVVHLAAQAGVRHSLVDPHAYVDANLQGFVNVLEGCRHHGCRHLVYASSSSVYGANTRLPFSVHDNVDHPISLYAASKKANELMAHAYSHLFRIPTTGLRFFTVYGPWGRPDMAMFIFASAILEGRPIRLFNFGKMRRDFTYVDDIVQGIVASLDQNYGYEVFNLGAGRSEDLMDFVHIIEQTCGKEGKKDMLPMQQGDVVSTAADISRAARMLGFRPGTQVPEGVPRFVAWYREYYGI
jgi:UDP-glucuronate 4-epimerase